MKRLILTCAVIICLFGLTGCNGVDYDKSSANNLLKKQGIDAIFLSEQTFEDNANIIWTYQRKSDDKVFHVVSKRFHEGFEFSLWENSRIYTDYGLYTVYENIDKIKADKVVPTKQIVDTYQPPEVIYNITTRQDIKDAIANIDSYLAKFLEIEQAESGSTEYIGGFDTKVIMIYKNFEQIYHTDSDSYRYAENDFAKYFIGTGDTGYSDDELSSNDKICTCIETNTGDWERTDLLCLKKDHFVYIEHFIDWLQKNNYQVTKIGNIYNLIIDEDTKYTINADDVLIHYSDIMSMLKKDICGEWECEFLSAASKEGM